MVFYVFFPCFFPFLYTAPFFANMAKRAANILERSLPRPPKTVDFLGTLHRYVDQQQGPAVADPIHGTLLAQANRKPAGSENVERTGLKNLFNFEQFCQTLGATYEELDDFFCAWAGWVIDPVLLFDDPAVFQQAEDQRFRGPHFIN